HVCGFRNRQGKTLRRHQCGVGGAVFPGRAFRLLQDAVCRKSRLGQRLGRPPGALSTHERSRRPRLDVDRSREPVEEPIVMSQTRIGRCPVKVQGTVGVSLLLLAFATVSRAASKPMGEADEKSVQSAVGQVYAALNTLFTGDVEPMKAIWSHADDVTYMGPGGGFQVGWDHVLDNWKAQAAMKLG